MELEKIQKLAELMNAQGLTRLTLKEQEQSLELCREPAAGTVYVPAPSVAPAAVPFMSPMAASAPAPSAVEGTAFPSPMVGVVYLAPSPDAAPYVSVGSKVKKGDVLCIIEAMKLMNEITAEQDGTVSEICVENAQVVEYGQPLFRLK